MPSAQHTAHTWTQLVCVINRFSAVDPNSALQLYYSSITILYNIQHFVIIQMPHSDPISTACDCECVHGLVGDYPCPIQACPRGGNGSPFVRKNRLRPAGTPFLLPFSWGSLVLPPLSFIIAIHTFPHWRIVPLSVLTMFCPRAQPLLHTPFAFSNLCLRCCRHHHL